MLKDQIQKDLTNSLKTGDQFKRLVLGMLATAVKNRELNKRAQLAKSGIQPAELTEKSQLNDEEVLEVISSEIKKRKEATEQFLAGDRKELAEREQKELEILVAYLPTQLSEAEIISEVDRAIDESGAKNVKEMGKVIGLVMAKIKGRADGSLVSKLIKDRLLK